MKYRFHRSYPVLFISVLAFLIGAAWSQDLPTLLAQDDTTVLSDPQQTPEFSDYHFSAPMANPYLIADVVEQVTPGVVYIEVEQPVPQRMEFHTPRPLFDPFFDGFFDNFFDGFFWSIEPRPLLPQEIQPEIRPRVSRGTGFIIDEEGHILTNQHVVGDPGDGQNITVKLNINGITKEVKADLIGSDYELDLAILKIEKPDEIEHLPVIPLGNSDKARPGEWVIAIGNPYGEAYEQTVTVGVLSAKGREISVRDRYYGTIRTYRNLFQTDAAINPGNSGGPLVNIRGEVIGINTAVNAAAQGIGFAIPINTALEVKEQLIQNGKVDRSTTFLGVELTSVDDDIARVLRLPEAKGAVIARVLSGSPAEQAGLRVYDVIEYFGETEIHTASDLVEAVRSHEPGDEVAMIVYRQGSRLVITVELGER